MPVVASFSRLSGVTFMLMLLAAGCRIVPSSALPISTLLTAPGESSAVSQACTRQQIMNCIFKRKNMYDQLENA